MGDTAQIIQGLAFKSKDFRKEGIPLLRISNIKANGKVTFGLPETAYLSPEILKEVGEKVVLHLDNIVIALSGATTGKIGLYRFEYPALLNQRVAKVVATDDVDQLFIFYGLLSKSKQLLYSANQMAQPNLSNRDLKNVKLPLPPLPEQKKIAEILSTVDDAIQWVDQTVQKTQRLKKGLMQDLLTRGIGHTEFKETEIGEIPEEWEVISLGQIALELYRYPTYYDIEYVNEGVREIRGEMIKQNGELEDDPGKYRRISNETSLRFSRTILEEGDFVLSVRGTMGKVAIVPKTLQGSNITANLMRLSLDHSICCPPFFKQVFLSRKFKRTLNMLSPQTTIRTIQAPLLKSLKLPLPRIVEQKKIAEILTTVDKRLERLNQKKGKLQRVKKGLMQDLLTGKKRVRLED